MSTGLFVVQVLNGLQFGVLRFLIAAGLTLVFGVMDFINLAHGVQYMLGAYLAVAFYALTGNFLIALVLALAAALLFGLLLEFVVLTSLRPGSSRTGDRDFRHHYLSQSSGENRLGSHAPDFAHSGNVQRFDRADAGSSLPGLATGYHRIRACRRRAALCACQPHARGDADSRGRDECADGVRARGRHSPCS